MSGSGMPAKQGEGFLERNPHLRENYLRVCAALEVQPWTDEAPEFIAVVSLDQPPPELLQRLLREFDTDA